MKTLINKSTKKYKYNCDRCNKEISYKEGTLHKLTDQYGEKKSKKACDLCDKCYKAFLRGVFKRREQKI